MNAPARNSQGFVPGSLIGTLIGLGGAKFRLPVLVSVFRLGTLEAAAPRSARTSSGRYDRCNGLSVRFFRFLRRPNNRD